eukprot:gene3876-10108_t
MTQYEYTACPNETVDILRARVVGSTSGLQECMTRGALRPAIDPDDWRAEERVFGESAKAQHRALGTAGAASAERAIARVHHLAKAKTGRYYPSDKCAAALRSTA